jgi:hypothetical protein
MTSLPVLHLKTTSRQNMTITDDPYETTATLYTFLRSIPSVAERELAFQPFLDALHAAPSSGRSALLRKPNHHLVQLLETVALDEVFRRTPRTIPALARHSGTWMQLLGYDNGRVSQQSTPSRTKAVQHKSGAEGNMAGQPRSPPSSSGYSPSPMAKHVVRAADMRQFADPYAQYEAAYQRNTENDQESRSDTNCVDANAGGLVHRQGEEVEEHLQYSGSTQAPEDPLGEAAEQTYRSYLSAEVSALTAAESDGSKREASANDGLDDRVGAGTVQERVARYASSAGGVHPVLELLARQVQQAAAVNQPSAGSAPDTLLDEAVKDKILRLTTRLDDVAEEISATMHAKEDSEQAWSPYYSRLKTCISFVEELQERLGSAISLYQLQRYERETLQQARVGVQMEALSLKLILRDVRARLEDAEEGLFDSGRKNNIEDVELIERLREVLSPLAKQAAVPAEEV